MLTNIQRLEMLDKSKMYIYYVKIIKLKNCLFTFISSFFFCQIIFQKYYS